MKEVNIGDICNNEQSFVDEFLGLSCDEINSLMRHVGYVDFMDNGTVEVLYCYTAMHRDKIDRSSYGGDCSSYHDQINIIKDMCKARNITLLDETGGVYG